jgi:hypothetical protein
MPCFNLYQALIAVQLQAEIAAQRNEFLRALYGRSNAVRLGVSQQKAMADFLSPEDVAARLAVAARCFEMVRARPHLDRCSQ